MITVNMTKAKSMAHDMRRAARAKEFEPWDEVIAKQIPGTDAVAAEAERQNIRNKYAAIQLDIDAADNVDDLTDIVKNAWSN